MIKTFAFFFVSAAAFAQPIGLGIKGGIPLTDAFNTNSNSTISYHPDTKRWVVGPQLEIRFPKGVGFEVDALYTRLKFSSTSTAANLPTTSVTTANSWEIPVLFKYKFGGASVVAAAARPFFTAGVSFRTLTGVTQSNTFSSGGTTITGSPGELRDRNVVGWVVGGGIELRALFLRFSPEIRYTHWNDPNFKDNGGLLESNPNQAQLLLAIHF